MSIDTVPSHGGKKGQDEVAGQWYRIVWWRWFKYLLAVSILVAGWMGLYTGVPISAYPESGDRMLALFRIVFASLLLFRLIRTRVALPMLWGWRSTEKLRRLWILWLCNTVLLLVGTFTTVCTLINFALFLAVFLRSRYFSIEEIYFQITSFILVFLPLGNVWSIDAGWSLPSLWSWQPEQAIVALNAYAWLLALLLMSAAYEKVSVDNWRKGLSFYYFIGLPHLVRPRFHFLRRCRWLCVLASYMTVIGQGGLAAAYFVPGLRELFLLKQIGFGVLLFTVVDISFIGQIFSLQFVLLLGFCAEGTVHYTTDTSSADSFSALYWLMAAVFTLASVRVFELKIPGRELRNGHEITSRFRFRCIPPGVVAKSRRRPTMPSILRLARRAPRNRNREVIPCPFLISCTSLINRLVSWSSGLMPIRVFGDMHLFGLYIYRIEGRARSGKTVLMPAFNGAGEPGSLQCWHPRYYQGAMYPVTDACLARRYFPHLIDYRRDRLDDLLYAALTSARARAAGVTEATLSVKSLNPDDHYVPDTRHWVDTTWTPIYRGYLSINSADMTSIKEVKERHSVDVDRELENDDGVSGHGINLQGEWLNQPPPVMKITRQLS